MRPRLCLLIVISIASLGATCGSAKPGRAIESPAAERVAAHYETWKRSRAPGGLTVRLGFAKGITSRRHQMGAVASVDLADNSLVVEAYGLPVPADVWWVDNRSGPDASALPDAGDEFVLVGSLAAGRSSVQRALGATASDEVPLELDLIVITPAGSGPQEQPLLLGGPGTFERLYAQERAGKLHADTVGGEIARLLERGRRLFEQETFAGNGRTCATCHPSLNNFTIDPRFIATLPDEDPLFVAERVDELAELENSRLLRARGVILENLDGFDRPGVLRGVPPTLALATSVTGPAIPFDNTANPAFGIVPPAERTGWSGDGSPGGGSLREFALGAVIQHFPRSLERVAGRDFRLPTDAELDALEIFQLSLGRQRRPADLVFASPLVREGKLIFERLDTAEGTLPAGKCALCHSRAGANIDETFFSELLGAPVAGNANFATGINELGALPSELVDPGAAPRDGGFARIAHDGINCVPPHGGFGTVTPEGGALPPGLCEEDFNTPPLVEAADTGPFFHNNAVDTLEAAVGFYNDDAFNGSSGGQLLAALDSGGVGIRLDGSQVSAVASFLRAVNAVENIRESLDLLAQASDRCRNGAKPLLDRALAEMRDAVEVLGPTGLAPAAVETLDGAISATLRARRAVFCHTRVRHLRRAERALARARDQLATPG
jgi:hypothetical protein